jgi:hypothetical protein
MAALAGAHEVRGTSALSRPERSGEALPSHGRGHELKASSAPLFYDNRSGVMRNWEYVPLPMKMVVSGTVNKM